MMKITKNTFYLFIIITICLGLSSCSKDNNQNQQNPNRETGSSDPTGIPSFSIKPFITGDQSVNQSGPPRKGLIEISTLAALSCKTEIQRLRDSNPRQLVRGSRKFINYLNIFYALTNFNDCNITSQAEEDGMTKLESGQFVSSQINNSNPKDNTRFVSWIYDEIEDSKSVAKKIARGKVVSLHLQKNKVRVNTRIDLSHHEGDRIVDNFIHILIPKKPPMTHREHDLFTRIVFSEISNDNNEVVEHRIGGRYYATTITMNDILTFIAVVKKGVGSVVFLKKCDDTNDPHASCDLSPGNYETLFYDANENDLTSAPDGIPATLEAIGFDHTPYLISDFYDGETEDNYLQPSFNP